MPFVSHCPTCPNPLTVDESSAGGVVHAQRAGIPWWCQRWELNAKADAVRLS